MSAATITTAGHGVGDDSAINGGSVGGGQHRRRNNDFANAKAQCLGKRDKSFAGRIDPKAVEICAVINERDDCYTTSSCAGRCFLYQGAGIKSTTTFQRFRISHDVIHDPVRYFDLTTLDSDPTGGGDPIRTIGQYDHQQKQPQQQEHEQQEQSRIGDYQGGTYHEDALLPSETISLGTTIEKPDEHPSSSPLTSNGEDDKTLWLRFEPFILHVACRSLDSASALMSAARPVFKNVGLTTWKDDNKYLVAIWGDEGLEMPLRMPSGQAIYQATPDTGPSGNDTTTNVLYIPHWLATLVNERHERNWNKINRFVQSVREMPPPVLEENYAGCEVNTTHTGLSSEESSSSGFVIPRSFDVIGDIAYLHSMPEGDEEHRRRIGETIMKRNKAIKLVVVRKSTMSGTERAPGSDGLVVIAGIQRHPMITSHMEYGIKCVVDLEHTFFSPRMGRERLRICQQVARGEHVLVLFAGVGMEALQIAGRTEAATVVAVEMNEVAVRCAQRAHRMLERNKTVKCVGASDRLEIIHGDVMDVVPNRLPKDHYDRILAPRPKEGTLDGDLGTGDGGVAFFDMCLHHLKQDGGECHWYDFVADHEFPQCERTRALLTRTCSDHGLSMEVLHIANAGSVAMRQFRVCIDFKVSKIY